MSEKLLSVGGLSVCTVSTNQTSVENRHATIPQLRLNGSGVDEVQKYRVIRSGVPVWAEHFMDCVGSIVVAQNTTLMTHHFGGRLVEVMGIFEAFGDVQSAIQQVDGGVAVIWRKAFNDKAEDRSYKQGSEMWYGMLSELYAKSALHLIDLVFSEWYWPLSAYYNGSNTLSLVSNVNDYEKLKNPIITNLK